MTLETNEFLLIFTDTIESFNFRCLAPAHLVFEIFGQVWIFQ